jgi:hypothetical protein
MISPFYWILKELELLTKNRDFGQATVLLCQILKIVQIRTTASMIFYIKCDSLKNKLAYQPIIIKIKMNGLKEFLDRLNLLV